MRRQDASELLDIRNGQVHYERVVAMAEEIHESLPAAQAASRLPDIVDQAMVGNLVMAMYERSWHDAAAKTLVAMPRDAVSRPVKQSNTSDLDNSVVESEGPTPPQF